MSHSRSMRRTIQSTVRIEADAAATGTTTQAAISSSRALNSMRGPGASSAGPRSSKLPALVVCRTPFSWIEPVRVALEDAPF